VFDIKGVVHADKNNKQGRFWSVKSRYRITPTAGRGGGDVNDPDT
jgi:hypothetical protein